LEPVDRAGDADMNTDWTDRLFRHKWLVLLVLLLGVAAGVLLLYALVRLELIQQVTALINKNTPVPLFLGLMLVLPMIGVPISVFIFVLGIKFGIGYGILLLALIMPFHILGSYAIALGIRQPMRKPWVSVSRSAIFWSAGATIIYLKCLRTRWPALVFSSSLFRYFPTRPRITCCRWPGSRSATVSG